MTDNDESVEQVSTRQSQQGFRPQFCELTEQQCSSNKFDEGKGGFVGRDKSRDLGKRRTCKWKHAKKNDDGKYHGSKRQSTLHRICGGAGYGSTRIGCCDTCTPFI
jgi:hypothetical protein